MFPVSHTLFGLANPWQNLSPLLSLLFIPFYPLAFLLHLLGHGDALDSLLRALWSFPDGASFVKVLPSWTLWLYGAIALAAIRNRWMFYILFGCSIGALGWIYG
jgi:competence protein ComEC